MLDTKFMLIKFILYVSQFINPKHHYSEMFYQVDLLVLFFALSMCIGCGGPEDLARHATLPFEVFACMSFTP